MRLPLVGLLRRLELRQAPAERLELGVARLQLLEARGEPLAVQLRGAGVAVRGGLELTEVVAQREELVLDALELLAKEVKAVDGVLTLLWHNETVSECNEWKGWRTVYEQVFERVC